MSLQDWVDHGWLVPHSANRNEIRNLLATADRFLTDARAPGLSIDGRLIFSYQAALQAAQAALAATGFRARGESHHFRAIQSLQLTLGLDSKAIERLDGYRKTRNVAEYKQAGVASEFAAQDAERIALQLRRDVETWIRETHPDLI
jgi:hypothetical protein